MFKLFAANTVTVVASKGSAAVVSAASEVFSAASVADISAPDDSSAFTSAPSVSEDFSASAEATVLVSPADA